MSKMKTKLAIFDLDGTLFDTRHVNFYSYRQALHEEGYSLSLEFYISSCDGKNYKDYLPLIIENPKDELMERIHTRKKQLYPDYLSKAVVNEHLFDIARLMSPEYYISIVTTASRKNCTDILSHFDKTKVFDLIIAQEDVARCKPDPEGFLKAMDNFKVSKENTIIFEDSSTGIEAARSSGAGVLVTLDFTGTP